MTVNTRKNLMLFLTMLLTASNAVPLRAAISPVFRKEMQLTAPERLKIKVKSVHVKEKKNPEYTACGVHVVAEILEVTHSATGLKVGQEIVLVYGAMQYEVPVAGSAPLSVLRKGETTGAFLKFNKQAKWYEPFANHGCCLGDLIVVD